MGVVIGSEDAGVNRSSLGYTECCAHNLEMCVYKLRIPSEDV